VEKRRKVRATILGVETIEQEDLKKSVILKDLVISETPNAIEEAMTTRSNFATIFEVNDSGNYVEIHKRDWISALQACLIYCVKKENYESCSKINKLIDKLKMVSSEIKVKKKS
jgi:hypothetical protein